LKAFERIYILPKVPKSRAKNAHELRLILKMHHRNYIVRIVLALITALVLTSCDGEEPVVEQAPVLTPTTFTIMVDGMTCGGCSSAITETLEPIPGVTAISVDHETGKAVVTTTGELGLPEKLSASINELGFKATLP
jgi:copper chaperone CopZ